MTVRLLKSLLEDRQKAMKAERGRCLLWDSELIGLGARISAKSVTFVVRYQRGTLERRMTIGTLSEFGTVEAARRAAADIRLRSGLAAIRWRRGVPGSSRRSKG